MLEINNRMSKVEKNSVKNAKRKVRRLKLSQQRLKGKGPQKKLIKDFDDVADDPERKRKRPR